MYSTCLIIMLVTDKDHTHAVYEIDTGKILYRGTYKLCVSWCRSNDIEVWQPEFTTSYLIVKVETGWYIPTSRADLVYCTR